MTTILQFGEGNFNRSFIEYLIQIRKDKFGEEDRVALVTPIDNPRWEMFKDAGYRYSTCVCGMVGGQKINEYTEINIVDDCINPFREYDRYVKAYMSLDLKAIISNTTEAGIAFNADDKFDDSMNCTFPAKMTKLLYARYKAYGEKGKLLILPLELIENNATTLKAYILKYADIWGLEDGFKKFVETTTFYNTLVDKIVPGFPKGDTERHFKALGHEDNLMTVGEAFLLWVIQGDADVCSKLAFTKDPRVKFVKDLKAYRERKVKILNGMHTALAPISLLAGIEIVRDAINDKTLRPYALALSEKEIMPTIDMDEAELFEFRDGILERFGNPFIDHYFRSIILNSVSKWKTRLLPSFLGAKEKGIEPHHMTFALAALFCLYDSDFAISDSPDVVEFFAVKEDAKTKFKKFLSNKAWWGMDLTDTGIFDEGYSYVESIKAGKIIDAIKAL